MQDSDLNKTELLFLLRKASLVYDLSTTAEADVLMYNFIYSPFHLQDTHRLYKQKLEEVAKLQDNCSGAIARQRKRLKELTRSLEE